MADISIKYDAHTHIASMHFMPDEFLDGVVDNLVAQSNLSGCALSSTMVRDRLVDSYQDHHADKLIKEMNRLSVDRAVVLLPDFTYALNGCELTIEEMFSEHSKILSRHSDRLDVFAGVDPRWGADGLALFIKGIEEYGFCG